MTHPSVTDITLAECGLGTRYLTTRVYRDTLYPAAVIKSFGDKRTEAVFSGLCPRQLQSIRVRAERKLTLIDVASSQEFLRAPPGNRLEALSGNRKGQYSIRINDQWRVSFLWLDGDAFDVEIVDYH